MLKPLGNKIIVQPTAPDTESAGGIIFPQTYGTAPPMTGTVVAVGDGPASARRVRASVLSACGRLITEAVDLIEDDARAGLAQRIHDLAAGDYGEVTVGDFVCFSHAAGRAMTVDGQDYIVLAEDDVEAVWTPDAEEAA